MLKKTVLSFICILLAGCSSVFAGSVAPSPTVDASTLPPSLFHFASVDCVAPCWQGIKPTLTDKATADAIMDELIHISTAGTNMRFYNGYSEIGYSVELMYREEIVYRTRIYPSEHRPQLGEVIDFLGDPDAVCLLSGTIPDSNPEYETNLVYFDTGIWLSSSYAFTEIDTLGQLRPDLQLTELTFFHPGEEFEGLEAGRTEKLVQCARKWAGYGGYEIYDLY